MVCHSWERLPTEVAIRWESWVQREKGARGTRFHYWFCCVVVVIVVV